MRPVSNRSAALPAGACWHPPHARGTFTLEYAPSPLAGEGAGEFHPQWRPAEA